LLLRLKHKPHTLTGLKDEAEVEAGEVEDEENDQYTSHQQNPQKKQCRF
jgi:hypothetical protein